MKSLGWAIMPLAASVVVLSSAHAMDEIELFPGVAHPSSKGTVLSLGTAGIGTTPTERYDLDLNLGRSGAVLDFYPFGEDFRFSAGVHLNQDPRSQEQSGMVRTLNSLVGGLAPAGTEVMQGDSYLGSVGLGFGHRLGEKLHLGVGAGVALGSEPSRVDEASDVNTGRFQEDAGGFEVAPAVGLTLDYKF